MSDRLRQRKTLAPCPACGLGPSLCICAGLPHLALKTRVTLIVHAKELKRTTNTGRLAVHCLANSAMCVRGEGRSPLDLTPYLLAGYETLLLSPGEDALDLAEFRPSEKPVHLLVPDGNWRQAAKVAKRHPELKDIPRVKLSHVNTALHHLRREHFPEGLSTLEAIARALGFLGEPEGSRALLEIYQAKLAATLRGRGTLNASAPSAPSA